MREERIKTMAEKATRRFVNAGLMRCWEAWEEQSVQRTRAMRKLKVFAARMGARGSPKLAASFFGWRADWTLESSEKARCSTHTQPRPSALSSLCE